MCTTFSAPAHLPVAMSWTDAKQTLNPLAPMAERRFIMDAQATLSSALDTVDRRILDVIQAAVPLVEEPFAAIGREIGLSDSEVLARIASMKAPGRQAIRQISAIFDSRSLGYESTLVAARIDDDRLDEAAAV